MSTSTSTGPTNSRADASARGPASVTTRSGLTSVGVLRSEWIKLWSLRSTVWSFALVIVVSVGMAVLISLATQMNEVGAALAPETQVGIVVTTATVGIFFGQMIVAVLGVMAVTGEYSTGMIKSSLAAVPRRLPMLAAKAVVAFVATYLVGFGSILASYLVASPILALRDIGASLAEPEVLRGLFTGPLFLALIAVFALGLGTIFRSTAGGIATTLGILLVLPIVLSLIPAERAVTTTPYLIGNAGPEIVSPSGFSAVEEGWQNLLIVIGWVAVSGAIGAWLLKRRDAEETWNETDARPGPFGRVTFMTVPAAVPAGSTPDASSLVAAGTVIAPGAVHAPGWVDIRSGRIVDCGAGEPPRPPDHSFPDGTLAPGYVDVHAHGGGGFGFDDPDSGVAAAVIAATHLAHGTTTLMASLVTAPLDKLERTVAALAPLVEQGLLAGIHLEGPWLSPAHRGAHDESLLREPDVETVDRLMRAGRGCVRMVTIAPELSGGLAAVRQIVVFGAVVAIGHTDATYDLTRQAIAAGATVGTHVFNAMRPLHHREPGPALALLEDPTVFAELIADGVHLHPAVVRLITGSASRPVFVTDAMAAAGADGTNGAAGAAGGAHGHGGRYTLGGLDVHVADGQARLADGTIAGSLLTLSAAVRYAVHTAGVPLAVAVRAATQNPADMIGLPDRGRLAAGHRADLIVLDEALHVTATMQAGVWCAG
jgi:N-acetylglucosamine-6-phosphate deacetylase